MDAPLSVAGTACHFPAGSSTSAQFRSALAVSGADGSVEVPFTRWELEEVWDKNPDAPGKMYPRHGAFVEGAEFFDAQFFGISAPEARFMDPQQRVLLEASLGGLLDAGFNKQELMGLEIAVHVGLANNVWIQLQSLDLRKVGPYTATGMSSSIAAARVS